MNAWDLDIWRETKKRDFKETEDFRATLGMQLYVIETNFDTQLDVMQIKGATVDRPAMVNISDLLHDAQAKSRDGHGPPTAAYWRDWASMTLLGWEEEASRFDQLTGEGEPFTEGVVKGLKEMHDLDVYMREEELERAKKEGREPDFSNGFPDNMTHVQRAIKRADQIVGGGPE